MAEYTGNYKEFIDKQISRYRSLIKVDPVNAKTYRDEIAKLEAPIKATPKTKIALEAQQEAEQGKFVSRAELDKDYFKRDLVGLYQIMKFPNEEEAKYFKSKKVLLNFLVGKVTHEDLKKLNT